MIKEKVSVILLSWNRKNEILKTLTDLQEQLSEIYEIIIVDQGSTDGTVSSLKESFSEKVTIYSLIENIGVPGGRNYGARKATGDIFLFLDNDASFNIDAVKRTKDKFKKNLNVGILGFKILIAGTDQLDLSSWAYQKSKIKDADKEFYTYTFCGCGHAIRKEVFDKVGYYWEKLFFSWEEIEFSIKALNGGYDILYTPLIEVYHRISLEKRVVNMEHECKRLQNSILVLCRYMPKCYAIWQIFLRILAYYVKGFRNGFFIKMFKTSIISLKALSFFLNNDLRIDKNILKKYKKLSDKGSLKEQLKSLFKGGKD